MRSPRSLFIHRDGWRVLLLVLLALGVFSARYSLTCLFTHCTAGDISPDGSRILVYDYMYERVGHDTLRARIADVKTGEILKDISDYRSERPRWRWAPDSKSVLGTVRTDEMKTAEGSRTLMQIDVSGTPNVIRQKSLSPSVSFADIRQDGKWLFVDEPGSEPGERPR